MENKKKEKSSIKIIFPLIVLALLGLFFLGDGITGWVTSQSCCFPPDCDEENLCPETQFLSTTQNLNFQGVYLGGILLILAIVGYIVLHHK